MRRWPLHSNFLANQDVELPGYAREVDEVMEIFRRSHGGYKGSGMNA